MRPGLEPGALGFLYLEPGPSLLKARAKPCLGPGLRGPGRAGLRALSPARHITTDDGKYNLRSQKFSDRQTYSRRK